MVVTVRSAVPSASIRLLKGSYRPTPARGSTGADRRTCEHHPCPREGRGHGMIAHLKTPNRVPLIYTLDKHLNPRVDDYSNENADDLGLTSPVFGVCPEPWPHDGLRTVRA
jgi:hypothetical protein